MLSGVSSATPFGAQCNPSCAGSGAWHIEQRPMTISVTASNPSALADILSRPERLAMMISALRSVGTHKRARLSRLSGLLIGAELAATRPWWLGQSVAVIGGGDLAQRYTDALAAQGVQATISGANMTLAGLARARALLRGA
jgi:2-dehydro-3-deoxygalactonokinase